MAQVKASKGFPCHPEVARACEELRRVLLAHAGDDHAFQVAVGGRVVAGSSLATGVVAPVADRQATVDRVVLSRAYRMYRIDVYWSGACRVTALANGSCAGQYAAGQWDSLGRLPSDVRAEAESAMAEVQTANGGV